MSFWLILRNIGTVISAFRTVQSVLSSVIQEKRKPTAEEAVALIDQVRALLDKKIIDVPGVDEDAISKALGEIEEHLKPKSVAAAPVADVA